MEEFSALLKALFKNEGGESYTLDPAVAKEIFDIFNKSEVSCNIVGYIQFLWGCSIVIKYKVYEKNITQELG